MLSRNVLRQGSAVVRTQVRSYADAPAGSVGATGDAFSKKEQANEAKYVQDREREKAERLKKHIADQRKALDDLEKGLNEK